MDSADVIVIGGGPAGTTAATYLAMRGHDVLLLEKETGPRHRIGESLLPSMMPILDDFGLVERVEALGFPRKTGGTFVWGKSREPWDVLFGNNPFLPFPHAYHVDRAVFDEVLLDHAKTTGVRVRRGEAAAGPLVGDDGRVAGVKIAGSGEEVRARFVVDASGPSAVLGKKLTTRLYDEKMRQVAFYRYYRDVEGPKGVREGHVLIETNPWGWIWYIPLTGALGDASLGLVTGQEFKDEYRELGPAAFFDRALAQAPFIQELLGPDARAVSETSAITDWAYTCEQTAGPGWYLAGDAAAFLDPLLSTGVTMAMLAGYSASVCIHTTLTDPARDQAAIDFYAGNYRRMYEVTRDFLHYFYAGNQIASRDEIFWRARQTLQFSESVGAAQAFCFLVNTIPANPHPALRKQIHMYQQFMAELEHPLDAMAGDEGFREQFDEDVPLRTFAELDDGTVPVPNGELESSFTIDADSHTLRAVRGITYDQQRPVFSSTSSWLLGRNLHALDDDACALIEAMDGARTWGEVVEAAGGDRERCTSLLRGLCDENLVLLKAS